MLLTGFLWVCFDQVSINPLARGVIEAQLKEIPSDSTHQYRNGEVTNLATSGVRRMAALVPDFILPGLIMLAGGVLLFLSARNVAPRNRVL
jgi:hypothetical protein